MTERLRILRQIWKIRKICKLGKIGQKKLSDENGPYTSISFAPYMANIQHSCTQQCFMLCVEFDVYSCTCCVLLPILCVLDCRWWPLSHITTAVAVVGRAGVSGAGSHKPQKRALEKELRDERTNNAPPRNVARVRARCACVCACGLVVE